MQQWSKEHMLLKGTRMRSKVSKLPRTSVSPQERRGNGKVKQEEVVVEPDHHVPYVVSSTVVSVDTVAVCNSCGQVGHLSPVCPQTLGKTREQGVVCYQCGQPGHKSNVCPQRLIQAQPFQPPQGGQFRPRGQGAEYRGRPAPPVQGPVPVMPPPPQPVMRPQTQGGYSP